MTITADALLASGADGAFVAWVRERFPDGDELETVMQAVMPEKTDWAIWLAEKMSWNGTITGHSTRYGHGEFFLTKGFHYEHGTYHYLDGKLHCESGPALDEVGNDGGWRKEWRRHGVLHRLDGPAYVLRRQDGTRHAEWWVNGQRHRDAGPDVVRRLRSGIVEYEA